MDILCRQLVIMALCNIQLLCTVVYNACNHEILYGGRDIRH